MSRSRSRFRTGTRVTAASAAALLALAACGGGADTADEGFEAPLTDETGEDTGGGDGAGGTFDAGSPADAVSLGLMLASVEPRDVDLDDDRDEFVVYCFGAPITEVSNQSGFALQGLDVESIATATSAELLEDDPNCVLASFEAGTDVSSYTLGVVGNSVVQDRSGEVNIQDSVTILGGEEARGSGATTAPELLRVSIDETLNQVRYVFDEDELGGESASAQAFGYYTANGDVQQGAEVVSVEDSSVIVQFPEDGAVQVDEATRFFVQNDAVQDQQGTGSTLGSAGAGTAAPDLIGVVQAEGSDTQYDFRFDEAVTAAQPGQFFLYTADAQRLTGSSVTIPDPRTVRVTFPEAMDFADQIVRGAVADGAATEIDPGGAASTIGAISRASGSVDTGPTSGPDLVDVTLEEETGRATFTFDATLEEESAMAGAFWLISDSGSVTSAREVVSVSGGGGVTGNEVVVLFDETSAMAAQAASVNMGAVQDQQGNTNPVRTVEAG
jgi:hypothetical protein